MGARDFGRRALLTGAPMVAGAAVLAQPLPAGAAPAGTRLANAVSPVDFGAVGDGVADDTRALEDALAQARVIDFGGSEMIYRITRTLLLAQTAAQVLTGQGATIRAGAPVNLLRVSNAAHTLRGLRFEGNGQSAGAGVIVQDTAVGTTVERCEFAGTALAAIVVNAVRTRIVGCRADRCGARAVAPDLNHRSTFLIAADHCSVLDNELLNCRWGIYFRGENASAGIDFYECRGNRIVCVAGSTENDLQGISNAYGRNGRIESNTVIGFSDNSIDCFGCRDMVITGNSTSGGKDGVFVGDEHSSNITITGNVFSNPRKGVRVLSRMENRLVAGVVITGNTVSNPVEAGFGVYGGQESTDKAPSQVTGITIADNSVHLAPGAYGIEVDVVEVSRISGNRIYRSGKEGILLKKVNLVEVSGNTIQDASIDSRNTHNAINVVDSHRVLVRDNLAYGTARYAVGINTGDGMTVSGTRWRAMSTGGLSVGPPTAILADNVGL